jgi:hypothetical protein
MAEADIGHYLRTSTVMWSNFLRFVSDGITVGELPDAVGLPKARMLSTLGGMERWRYVTAGPEVAEKRDGWGSARGLRSEWVVRPTAVGLAAQEIWPPLFAEVERRWEERFGKGKVDELRQSLRALVEQVDVGLPEYLPIVAGTNGMVAEITPRERAGPPPGRLCALLAQALLAYTLDFERTSVLSLPLSENVVRVLDETGVDIRDLPQAAAVSSEATSMALTFLKKRGYVVVADKVARLTPEGVAAREAAAETHTEIESQFDAEATRRLRAAMQALLEQRDGERPRLALGLEPHAGGWRASGRYLRQTEAMLESPRSGLPRYPMVLHRGGWPDGS